MIYTWTKGVQQLTALLLTELCFNSAFSVIKYGFKKQSKEICLCICCLKNSWVGYWIYHSMSPIEKSPSENIYSRKCSQKNIAFPKTCPSCFQIRKKCVAYYISPFALTARNLTSKHDVQCDNKLTPIAFCTLHFP